MSYNRLLLEIGFHSHQSELIPKLFIVVRGRT